MSQSIHGHEVMEMMLEEGGHFTRASLREAIEARFGADARFHTCSASEMDAEALIPRRAYRGARRIPPPLLYFALSPLC